MATTEKDVNEVAEELGKKFDEFKEKHNKELDGIKAEKSKLAGEVEKLNEKVGELDKLKSDMEEELKLIKRPTGNGSKSKDVLAHEKAFTDFLRKGAIDGLGDLQQKALQTTVDADGGYAVPEELDRNIVELLRNESPMRRICNQITVGSPDYKRLVNKGGAGAGWVDEDDARPDTGTPTLANVSAFMGELYANPQATQTSLDDIFFNAEAWLTSEIAIAFAATEGAAFLAGDGVKKPKGILSYTMALTDDDNRNFGTLQNRKSGADGVFTGDNLIDLVQSLKKGYRQNAVFMMNSLTVGSARKLKGSDGHYLWQPGLQAGQPSTLIGYMVEENEDMPDAAADANAIMFGDFKRGYTIVDRMGTRMLRDPFSNKPYVGFYTTKRVGGMLVDSNAIKVLTLGD